jgi:DNA primase
MGNHPAKYINSPQTPYFNKSQVLYAYHLAKESIHKHKKIIITEGYLDVIMLHQAGFDTAVATLGTALTKEHFPLLRRGEPTIILAYDGDNAGQNAALKGAQLLLSGGFRGGVVLFEQGKDPADMVKENRIEELSNLFHHPIPLVSFILKGIIKGFDLTQTDQKEKAFQEVQTFLLTLSPFLQEEFKGEAASLLGLNPTLIRTKLAKKASPFSAPLRANYDIQEAILLKTAHDFPPLIERLLDFGSTEIFHLHHDAFDALVWHTPSHPLLDEIIFDDSIKSISDEEEIKKAIFYQKERFLNKKLEAIKNDPTLAMSAKAFSIRKCHEDLLRLKKGDFSPLS